MSMIFCHNCNKDIDTDFNVEHFTEDEECIKSQEIMVNKAAYIELKASQKMLKNTLMHIKEIQKTFGVDSSNRKIIRLEEWDWKLINDALKQAK